MSGHSKWATIKHKKAATDAKRGKIFTKIIRELTIAARTGGADPDTNPRLRTAILAAKGENMPNDNIERAIQRGTGTLEGETLDEVTFEGYGPGGVGVLVQVVTSNRNRIVSEIRHMFSKNGGNMAETGAVGWMFHRKGDIVVPKEAADEEKMMSIVLDAGAEDLRDDGSAWEVTTPPEAFEKVREALLAAGVTPSTAEVGWVPQNYVKLSGQQAQQMVRMVETLEDRQLRHRRKRNSGRGRELTLGVRRLAASFSNLDVSYKRRLARQASPGLRLHRFSRRKSGGKPPHSQDRLTSSAPWFSLCLCGEADSRCPPPFLCELCVSALQFTQPAEVSHRA